jgi:hypothetical protein
MNCLNNFVPAHHLLSGKPESISPCLEADPDNSILEKTLLYL